MVSSAQRQGRRPVVGAAPFAVIVQNAVGGPSRRHECFRLARRQTTQRSPNFFLLFSHHLQTKRRTRLGKAGHIHKIEQKVGTRKHQHDGDRDIVVFVSIATPNQFVDGFTQCQYHNGDQAGDRNGWRNQLQPQTLHFPAYEPLLHGQLFFPLRSVACS